MTDQNLARAALSLSRAIGDRWGGRYAVRPGADAAGAGVICVSYDPGHRPGLSLSATFNGYPVWMTASPPAAV